LKNLIAICLKAGRIKVLVATAVLVALVALGDWLVGRTVSLAPVYILPMMLGAVVLRPHETALLAIVGSFLRAWFDTPASETEVILRFVFAFLGYYSSALFVTALVRNRELEIEHLSKIQREQQLRREAEEQLRVLVESSPAAILTVDGSGVVLAANSAAGTLFAIPEGHTLHGRSIGDYLPLLADALRLESGEGFRTAAQCQGRNQNGDIFLANTWFSSYVAPEGKRLAAIVVDASEEMRDREEENLKQLTEANRITAAAVSHEVRNLCVAISLMCSNLKEKDSLAVDDDFQGLTSLVQSLQTVSSLELRSKAQATLEEVSLQQVLDNLRIVIEPGWRDIDGSVRWRIPDKPPVVVANPHGLLQVFLNLAQNSHRAVQDSDFRELAVAVSVQANKALVSFQDSGPGVAAPHSLFQPFQPGANGSGLGLYVSRAVVRSYGGDLRFEPIEKGSRFTVELQAV
jgi:two-component system sensor kinase FixL